MAVCEGGKEGGREEFSRILKSEMYTHSSSKKGSRFANLKVIF